MEQIQLSAKIREELGKSGVQKLRNAGKIPAIVYGQGETPLPLEISSRDFLRILHVAGGNVIVNLQVEGHKTEGNRDRTVLIKEVQQHPVSGEYLHIDFHEVSLTKQIKVNIPVVAKGESVGVKLDGGVLDHSLWELEVFCLPTQIPEKIEVDVSHLKIGDTIHVKDLSAPAGIKILTDPQTAVFTVKHPSVEEVKPVQEGVQEPEVIREKKPEAEQAEPQPKTEAAKETKGEEKGKK